MPLSSRFAWCPSCNIGLIPFYFLMEWLLDKTEVELPITNSCLIIMILLSSFMLNFWFFIMALLISPLYWPSTLNSLIWSSDSIASRISTFALDLAYSSSIFNFSSWILADCLFLRNSASAKSSTILSFSCKALLSFDHLLKNELDDEFLLEECLEVTLLDLDDNCSFLSCSASLIQLLILFLNDIVYSSMSSNQSSSCSCISRGSKELYSLCTSISWTCHQSGASAP